MLYLHELFSANNLPNILLFFAGLGGIAVGIWTLRYIRTQTTLLNRYVEDTNLMAISALRPKLLIRGFEIVPGEMVNIAGQTAETQNWRVRIGVANSGGSKASIVASNLTITKTDPFSDGFRIVLPTFPPYSEEKDSFGHFTIDAGEHNERTMTLDFNVALRLKLQEYMRAGGGGAGHSIYWMGFLQYEDSLKINRRTAFAFRYDVETQRFDRVENPEYNYAD